MPLQKADIVAMVTKLPRCPSCQQPCTACADDDGICCVACQATWYDAPEAKKAQRVERGWERRRPSRSSSRTPGTRSASTRSAGPAARTWASSASTVRADRCEAARRTRLAGPSTSWRRAMAERSIRLHDHEVRAVLSGAQTQVRRVLRPQPPAPGEVHRLCGAGDIVPYQSKPGPMWSCAGSVWAARRLMGCEPRWRCPWGEPGDLLWVRETWAADRRWDDYAPRKLHRRESVWWRAGSGARVRPFDQPTCRGRWRPSIHMPWWASRLTLRVTEVRIERLTDISEEDALAEGVDPYEYPGGPLVPSARGAFFELWDKINAKRAPWADNPWVWAIRFERVTLKPALRPGYGCPGCGWSDHMCDCPERFLRRRS